MRSTDEQPVELDFDVLARAYAAAVDAGRVDAREWPTWKRLYETAPDLVLEAISEPWGWESGLTGPIYARARDGREEAA